MRADPRYTAGVHSVWIVNAAGALVGVLLLGFGYFLEYAEGLAPCPLCVLQRAAFAALAVVSAAAAIHRPRSRGGAYAYGVAGGIAAASGAGVAARHVHLQNLPPGETPECGPGLEYMLDTFPITEAVRMILTGSGECAEVSWSFLSLSIPTWSLIWFIVLGLVCLANNFRTPPGFRPRLFD